MLGEQCQIGLPKTRCQTSKIDKQLLLQQHQQELKHQEQPPPQQQQQQQQISHKHSLIN